jgi:hypothetical protein
LGCAIFGITEVPTDGVEFDMNDFAESNVGESPTAVASSTDPVVQLDAVGTAYTPPKPATIPPPVSPTVLVPPPVVNSSETLSAPKSMWDPEKGEVWIDTEPPGAAPVTDTFPFSTQPSSPARSVDPPARLVPQQAETHEVVDLLDDGRGRGHQDPPAPNASFSELD